MPDAHFSDQFFDSRRARDGATLPIADVQNQPVLAVKYENEQKLSMLFANWWFMQITRTQVPVGHVFQFVVRWFTIPEHLRDLDCFRTTAFFQGLVGQQFREMRLFPNEVVMDVGGYLLQMTHDDFGVHPPNCGCALSVKFRKRPTLN